MDKDLTYQIKELKKEKNAIILAHFYQPPEIQELADAVGDSYYLSEIARDCKEEVVVFCGVRFMGESAKILSPEKTVLMPVSNAGCAMADMVDEEGVIKLKQQYPNALVVCYINSTAKVKAHCDGSYRIHRGIPGLFRLCSAAERALQAAHQPDSGTRYPQYP